MNILLKKWYTTAFVFPLILTYLTSYIQLPDIVSNWEYSIILSLLILVIILVYEIVLLNKRIAGLELTPTANDRNIIKNLLQTLNLKMFQEDIVSQDSWNGYKSEAIHNLIEFKHESALLENQTSVEELNILIADFLKELNIFIKYSSNHVYGKGNWLVPFKDNPEINPREKVKEDTKTMNLMSKRAFEKLEKLMIYLRSNDYL